MIVFVKGVMVKLMVEWSIAVANAASTMEDDGPEHGCFHGMAIVVAWKRWLSSGTWEQGRCTGNGQARNVSLAGCGITGTVAQRDRS